jgi:hypothetical protein
MTWLVRAAIVALYPRTGALPGVEDCGLDAFLVKFKRESPGLMWVGVVAGAVLFHLTPLFTVYVPLPAFWLPAALRDRHTSRITTTDVYLVRQAVFLVKLCAGFCWGADDKVRAAFALPALPADPMTWRKT